MRSEKVYVVETPETGILVYQTMEDLLEWSTKKIPDAEIDKEAWVAADKIVRKENGKYVLGKSQSDTVKEISQQKAKEAQLYLSETDYVANKLAEVMDDQVAYQALKREYAEVLVKRQQARWAINNALS